MKIRALAIFSTTVFLLSSACAWSIQMDLKSAINAALSGNPTVASAKEGEQAAKAKLSQANSVDAVRVNLNVNYSYVDKSTLFGGMTVLDKNTNTNTLSVYKPVYTSGAAQAAKEQARWGIEASGNRRQTVEEDLSYAVARTFIGVLEAEENIKVADDAVTFLTSNLDSAVKMKEAGTAPKSDVYRAETDLSSAKDRQIQARTTYKTQLAILKNLLSLPSSAEIEPVNTLPGISSLLDAKPSISARSEIKALENSAKGADAAIKLAKTGDKPTVAVSADFMNIGTGAEFPRKSDTLGFGITASLPIFDGGATKGNVDEARAIRRKIEKDLESAKHDAELDIAEARFALEGAQARISAGETHVKSAKESARALEVSYKEGIAPITDVLSARSSLTEANTEEITARYDKYAAQIRLLRAEGKILDLASLK